MNYPDYFPTQEGFTPESAANESFRYAWEKPMQANSHELARMLISAAKTIESEGGLCQQSYAVREAAMRIDETLRIIGEDLPCYKQMDEITLLHSPKSNPPPQ